MFTYSGVAVLVAAGLDGDVIGWAKQSRAMPVP